jgi:Exostosin family
MLYPFWGKNPEDPADPNSGRFDRYAESGAALFVLAPIESADLAVFPTEWSEVVAQAAGRYVEGAAAVDKPTAVFVGGDEHQAVPHEGALVFQTSLVRSRRRPNEFAQPAWSEDFVTAHLGGRLPIRSRGARPVVGFCGLAPPSRGMLTRFRAHPAHTSVRARALRLLREHEGVETNFVERERFLGGAIARGRLDLTSMRRVRNEYVANMVESDYILCSRGAGNFSYRLYETLSCGRIPVFVDTDCVLPYDFVAPWREHCVWVDESELEFIGDRVAGFHEGLAEGEFEELQRACRRFWEEYIAPEGFFGHFHEHLVRA